MQEPARERLQRRAVLRLPPHRGRLRPDEHSPPPRRTRERGRRHGRSQCARRGDGGAHGVRKAGRARGAHTLEQRHHLCVRSGKIQLRRPRDGRGAAGRPRGAGRQYSALFKGQFLRQPCGQGAERGVQVPAQLRRLG